MVFLISETLDYNFFKSIDLYEMYYACNESSSIEISLTQLLLSKSFDVKKMFLIKSHCHCRCVLALEKLHRIYGQAISVLDTTHTLIGSRQGRQADTHDLYITSSAAALGRLEWLK